MDKNHFDTMGIFSLDLTVNAKHLLYMSHNIFFLKTSKTIFIKVYFMDLLSVICRLICATSRYFVFYVKTQEGLVRS